MRYFKQGKQTELIKTDDQGHILEIYFTSKDAYRPHTWIKSDYNGDYIFYKKCKEITYEELILELL